MSKIIYILLLILATQVLSCTIDKRGTSCESVTVLQEDSVISLSVQDSSQSIRLLVAGDLMQHELQIFAAQRADSSYDYSGYFDYVSDFISQADIAMANLEVTLGDKPFRGFPRFSAPDEFLSAIQEAGFDLLFTGNNHSCDSGKKGILRTIQMCDSLSIPHIGTYADSASRSAQYPYLLEKNGFRIAILEFSYGTNGLRIPEPTIVNLMDTVQLGIDIAKAKRMNPDLIVAFPHWGVEYETLPSKRIIQRIKWLLDKGVDHVIGGHPHVVQPIELRYDSLADQQHLVAYSLGNFVSDQSTLPKYGGLMLRIDLKKEGPMQPARIVNCDYILTFVSRPTWGRRKNYRIYPVSIADSLLNATERKKRDAYVRLARDLFAEHNIGVSEYITDSI